MYQVVTWNEDEGLVSNLPNQVWNNIIRESDKDQSVIMLSEAIYQAFHNMGEEEEVKVFPKPNKKKTEMG